MERELAVLLFAGSAILLRGLLAAAETALASVGREEADEMASGSLAGAARVVRLKARPEETLTALRAGQLALVATATALCAITLLPALSAQLEAAPLFLVEPWSVAVGAAGIGLGVAFVTLLFGELIPRAYAVVHPRKLARRLSLLASWARLFALPVVRFLFWMSDLVLRRLGLDLRRSQAAPPLEDLERYLTDLAREGGVAAPTPELIHSIFEFGETTAKEVMIARTNVVAIDIEASGKDVLDLLSDVGHTRLPVYEGKIDNIVGIINAKDIIPVVRAGKPVKLSEILRETTFVPWSKPINELMREFQTSHIHMAIVVDEFGGTMGVITLEDILEEIVGEIEDEFDRPEGREVALADGSFLVDGSIEIEVFNERFQTEIPVEGDYETLAGFLNSLAGAIPNSGDTFFYSGLQLSVAKRDDRHVSLVRVRRRPRTE